MKTVVVLGGYGNFGKRIVENLATIAGITIIIAGRNVGKARALISALNETSVATLQPLKIDILDSGFTEQLRSISPYLVIHTSGPFQGQDYRVPNACIDVGAHYIDLADDRQFVCDIIKLNDKAKQKGLLIASGASSVPGLSSAVVDHYKHQFSNIEAIDIAIAPGNKAERGLATVAAILSYTGHALDVFKEGRWQHVYGWMDSQIKDFGGIVGKRHLANVDVPDLALFPERYQVSQRVSFQAGLELPLLHRMMVAMAYFSKIGLVKSWAPLAKIIVKTSNIFLPFGTDQGAMEVLITGKNKEHSEQQIKWTLYAPDGNGPYIPILSTIILARQLLENRVNDSGAKPCMQLLTLQDFEPYFPALGIYFEKQISVT